MNLKKYLPVENYTLTTRLPVAEVRRRIADSIEPKTSFILPMSNKGRLKPYEGQLVGDTFTINKIIDYKNSFLPIITGNISASRGQTEVAIKMGLAPLVLVFIVMWFSIISMICLSILLSGLLRFSQILQPGFDYALLIPFGMLLFFCGITVIPFRIESKKSKQFLAELLNGQETSR